MIVPPEGYLREVREICSRHDILFIADEIQTGLGRTERLFACDHEDVRPDVMVVGKALSGGAYPVSAVLSSSEILGERVFPPGSHGSTFGGNPLACAVARQALRVLLDEGMVENAARLGKLFLDGLKRIESPHVKEVRGRGLLIGVELYPGPGTARRVCEALLREGLLCKETHETVIRLAPPLLIEREAVEWALERIAKVLRA